MFNAPGWYFASDWVCEKMQHFTDAAMDVDVCPSSTLIATLFGSSHSTHAQDALHMRKTTERMCAMDPAVSAMRVCRESC